MEEIPPLSLLKHNKLTVTFNNLPFPRMLKVAVSSEVVKWIVNSRVLNYFPPQAENAVLDLTRLLNCLEASLAILTS